MQRRCSVPGCEQDVRNSDTSSYYRFPLQEPARLQRWLRNMGRESWSPSLHELVCHRHFAASCFRERRGIRELLSDAVPTHFMEVQKRKATDQIEKLSKRLHTDDDQRDRAAAVEVAAAVSASAAVAGAAETESSHRPCDLTSQDAWGGAQLTPERQRVNRITVAVLTQGHRSGDAAAAPPGGGGEASVGAYFETIPGIALGDGEARAAACADTALTFALSSRPAVSVVPIVSQREAPPPGHRRHPEDGMDLEEDEEEEEEEEEEDETNHQQGEEHSYHRSSVAVEQQQLEVMVVELQRKMSALQQHHHHHLDKLLQVESSVTQLRHSNLLSQERLQLLENAYVHTAAVTDTGETVTIFYDQDAAAFLYTPLDEEL